MQKIYLHFTSKLTVSALVAEFWDISFKMLLSSALNNRCHEAPRPIPWFHTKLLLNALFLAFDISLESSSLLWPYLHPPTDTPQHQGWRCWQCAAEKLQLQSSKCPSSRAAAQSAMSPPPLSVPEHEYLSLCFPWAFQEGQADSVRAPRAFKHMLNQMSVTNPHSTCADASIQQSAEVTAPGQHPERGFLLPPT